MRENRSYIWLPGKGGKRNRWGRAGAPLAARRPLLRVGGWENKIMCGSGGEYQRYGGYSQCLYCPREMPRRRALSACQQQRRSVREFCDPTTFNLLA